MRPHEHIHVEAIHDLGTQAIRLFALTKDPLTASAAAILLKTKKLPLNAPQQNALRLVEKQLQAYSTLYTDPLQ